MNIERIQKSLAVAIIASETSHIFCCVLPTAFSILSLLSGFGLVAAMPAGLEVLHEALHQWEIPMILMSGMIVALGWGAHYLAVKMDCSNTGCCHEPCGPKKRKSGNVLKVATYLFAFNVGVFLFFHHGLEVLF